MVKNLNVVQETWVQSMGQEDPLKKEMATQYSCLENPTKKSGGEEKWQPLPIRGASTVQSPQAVSNL